jgi:hypothetical protein
MTYRIVVEPAAERELRSAVRWRIKDASAAVAAEQEHGLNQKIDMLGLTK